MLRQGLTERLVVVDKLLVSMYGKKEWESRGDPLDSLIETVLSQNTSDLNSGRAFESLKSRFRSWEEVLAAPRTQVADAIRVGGLSWQKSRRIQDILEEIERSHGSLNLDFLRSMDDDAAFNYLMRFTGVGPKTAACVLMFALHRPVFPVDTHVHRVSLRLGLVDGGTTAEDTQYQLQEAVPDSIVYQLHVNMVTHGRRTCKARDPVCFECALSAICDYYQCAARSQA